MTDARMRNHKSPASRACRRNENSCGDNNHWLPDGMNVKIERSVRLVLWGRGIYAWLAKLLGRDPDAEGKRLLERDFGGDTRAKLTITVHDATRKILITTSSANDSWRIQWDDLDMIFDKDKNISVIQARNYIRNDHSFILTRTSRTECMRIVYYPTFFATRQELDVVALWKKVSKQLESICREKLEECKFMERELEIPCSKDETVDKLAEMKKFVAELHAKKDAWEEVQWIRDEDRKSGSGSRTSHP